jgi:hypothetical protein
MTLVNNLSLSPSSPRIKINFQLLIVLLSIVDYYLETIQYFIRYYTVSISFLVGLEIFKSKDKCCSCSYGIIGLLPSRFKVFLLGYIFTCIEFVNLSRLSIPVFPMFNAKFDFFKLRFQLRV